MVGSFTELVLLYYLTKFDFTDHNKSSMIIVKVGDISITRKPLPWTL